MGLRRTREIADPYSPDGDTLTVAYPSRLRLRTLMAEARSVKRLPGESKDQAEGFALIDLVLHDSIKDWSYCDEQSGEPIECTPENIDELDSKTSIWLFKELTGQDSPEGKDEG